MPRREPYLKTKVTQAEAAGAEVVGLYEGVKVERCHVIHARGQVRVLIRMAFDAGMVDKGRTAKDINRALQRAVEAVEYLDDIEREFDTNESRDRRAVRTSGSRRRVFLSKGDKS